MRRVLLSEIIHFSLGKNATRIKEHADLFYTPEDFEKDLHGVNPTDDNAVCIINLIRSTCSPLSIQNESKLFTSNFLRCDFDTKVLNPWYFSYMFNEGKSFAQQIQMYHQGSTLSVKKLNVKSIGDLTISLPELEKQKQIGDLYKQSIIQNDLLHKKADLMQQFTVGIIRELEEKQT